MGRILNLIVSGTGSIISGYLFFTNSLGYPYNLYNVFIFSFMIGWHVVSWLEIVARKSIGLDI